MIAQERLPSLPFGTGGEGSASDLREFEEIREERARMAADLGAKPVIVAPQDLSLVEAPGEPRGKERAVGLEVELQAV
jgi:hypothetical protein